MPNNPQQNDLGMESNALIVIDGSTMTGAGCTTVAAGRAVGLGWTKTPAGFGRGCRISDAATFGGTAIVGGDRRSGTADVPNGRGTRGISCFALSFWRTGIVSGLGGSAMRTISCFGSAMTDHVAPRKIAKNSLIVTL